MAAQTHSLLQGKERHVWTVERLWHLSATLEPFDFVVSDFDGLDEDCWYGSTNTPTIRSVLDHMQRIEAADLRHPVILSETGVVMDGLHRICKAWLAGHTTIRAVRFPQTPPPDRIEAWPPT